ncbi:hypothetical protein [Sediminicola sp. 1XM1-17]|uniref:hypothetical protein n=1 Tax=Sediminicola sp. 1XM1-17 TaxID=3127702 RepID=UPI0030769A8A
MNKDYYAEKGLIVGIGSILMAFTFFASTLFTPRSSLSEITGHIDMVKVFYNQVNSSRGGKSVKSELKFTLVDYESVFVLTENIGNKRYNYLFEQIKKRLNQYGELTVWVKKSQKRDFKPHVFKIADGNGDVLYDIPDAKAHSKFGFLIAMGVGFFGIGLYSRHRYLIKKN